jgi:integrase
MRIVRTKIRQRSSGRWYLSAVYADGSERSPRTGGFATKREAKAAATRLLVRPTPRPGQPVTLGEHLESWLVTVEAEGRVAPSTLESDRWAVRAWIAPRIGGIPLPDLTGSDLEGLYAELGRSGNRHGKPLASKTIRNVHLLVHRALEDARSRGTISVNPARDARAPRGRRRERQAWTQEQARAFLAVADRDYHAVLWRLLLSTGLRRGELLGLQWSDVDVDARTAHVGRQVLLHAGGTGPRLYVREELKGRRDRTVYFDGSTAEALKAWKKAQAAARLAWGPRWRQDGGLGIAAAWLATEDGGYVLHPDTLHDRFRRLAKTAGVPQIVLHSARHTYATLALRAGARVDLVSRGLGHASVGFTSDVYVHPGVEEYAEAAELVGKVLGD